ncbi:unnamed protein product [Natator depressus]
MTDTQMWILSCTVSITAASFWQIHLSSAAHVSDRTWLPFIRPQLFPSAEPEKLQSERVRVTVGPCNKERPREPASWNRLLVRGVVAVVGVLVSLYLCGFWKGRGKAFAYPRLVFRKLLTHPSQQPGSP